MSSTLVSIIATGVLSGGFVAGIAQVLNARNESRRLRIAEQDADVRDDLKDAKKVSIAVEAAERSVISLNTALNRAEKEITRLEHTVLNLTTEVSNLRAELQALREDNHSLNYKLARLQNGGI